MFGFFKQSKPYKVIDKVWISKEAKCNACSGMVRLNPNCIFVAWFEETQEELKALLGEHAGVYLADQLNTISLQDRMVVFAEHYPLRKREEDLFDRLQLKEIPVLSGLDEYIFKLFGGENLISMMRKLGVDEKEVLGHSMITRSIENAQRKLEKKVKIEKAASSQEEWFALNLQG